MKKKPDSLGIPLGRAVAMASLPEFSGSPGRVYLCDAGCRPNPGSHLPVIWDGNAFLDTKQVVGTNHRASYQAVKGALVNAEGNGVTHVELRLTSDLVYRQLSTGSFCRNPELASLRDALFDFANKVSPVRLVLVREPFRLDGQDFPTRKKLRDYVLSRRRDLLK